MHAQCAISLIECATVAPPVAAAKVEQSSEQQAYTILSRGQTSTAHKHTTYKHSAHTLKQSRQESNKENTKIYARRQRERSDTTSSIRPQRQPQRTKRKQRTLRRCWCCVLLFQ